MPQPVDSPRSDLTPTLNTHTPSVESVTGPVPCDPEPTAATVPPSRYQPSRFHARGGLGEIHVALDSELNREVALKQMRPDKDDAGGRQRFVLEAEVTGRLQHPGVVPVYGLGTYADGRPYYAMRFIKGDSLQKAIDAFHAAELQGRDAGERSLALRALLRRFIDVCNAVGYAHSKGVLHRDLKPDNIMLGAFGETLVVDWGLAKILGDAEGEATESGVLSPSIATTATQDGTVVGTPAYMSPEQALSRNHLLTPATDIYSLGGILYTLLTSRLAFQKAADVVELLGRVAQGVFPPPCDVNPAVPPPLAAVCLKAMALRRRPAIPLRRTWRRTWTTGWPTSQ